MQILFILVFLTSTVGTSSAGAEGQLQVVSATPNGSGAAISSKIEINFDQAIEPASFAGSINGQPMVPTQIVVQSGDTQVAVDPGELEYGKTYSVIVSSTVAAAGDPSTTLGTDYAFSFTVITNTNSKHPSTTVDVPASSLEVGQQYTISGQASGYVWERDPDNPLELELYGADGTPLGSSGMLHPTALYFPQGMDGYKFWLTYTGTGGSVENPITMRSNDGVHFTSDGIANPLFTYNYQLPFDTQNLADPEAYYLGNTWMMFYEMEAPSLGDWMGTGGNIGLALSTDGTIWEPYGGPYTYDPANPPTDFPANGNPVIKPTSASYRSGEMAVIFKDGLYHMWRTVIEGGLFIDHDTATDPRGPWTLQSDQLSMGGYEYGPHPDVVYDAARNLYLMLYLIPSGANVGQLGLYTSSSPSGPWVLHPINPIFTAQSAWEGSRLYRSAMVNVDGQWYLYYTGNATSSPQLGLAREVSGVRGVEVSTDGGSTWRNVSLNANGSWTYQWTPTQPGTFSVKARVIDDFMQGDPTSGISVSVGSGPLPTLQAPILVITDSSLASNPFASYLTEILRAEGLTEFQQIELGSLMADAAPLEYLANFSVVLLAESSTNSAARQVLSDYVTGGGNLIAMQPDTAMADLFGLTYVNVRAEQNLEFFAIDASTDAGRGIYQGSLQYHGEADNYTLDGATALAYLWNSISSPSSNPAVSINHVGAGSAVAFTFDLAKSIVMMRQGNPAWKDTEGDATGGYRPMDMFERSNTAWWIAGPRMRIPQADEEQRFLANLVLTLSSKPLPRMWYLPGEHNSVFVSTGDAEGAGGPDLNPVMNDIAAYGGRYTNYLMESGISSTTPEVEASWRSAGMGIGPHVDAADTCAALAPAYAQITANILAKFGHPAWTARSHTISWCGWTEMAEIEANNGTELDTNYYHYNADLLQYGENANGYFTGSGMPQPFMNEQGDVLSIYQAATQFPDEWFADTGQTATYTTSTIESLMNAAENGYYSAFVANIHHVRYDGIDPITHTWANNIWAYARDNDIPLWSAEDLLFFVKARNASHFQDIQFEGGALTFDFVPGAARTDLSVMIPAVNAGNNLLSIQVNGLNQAYNVVTVKGLEYARFIAPSSTAHVVATYGLDTTAPVISNVQANAVTDVSAAITWQTNEPASSLVEYGTDAAALNQTGTAAGNVTTHDVQLSGLNPSTTYHYRVKSIDRAGNLPAVSDVFTFTTGAARWTETTTADFSDGTLDNTQVTTAVDGEVTLGSGSSTANFEGTSLDTNTWFAKNLLGGDPVVTVSGGNVTVSSGTYIRTNQSYFQRSLEGSMTFQSGQYAHFGWADTLQAGDDGIADPSWIMFSASGNGIQARIRLDGIENNITLSGLSAVEPHIFKIVWNTDNSIEFWVDGVLKATDTRNFTQPLRVYLYNTSADWVSILGDYASSGVYQSSVFDTGQASHFDSLTWTGTIPDGTSATFATRTSDDGTAWGDWQAPGSGGTVESPDGQFIQYQISLVTDNVTVAPNVGQVTVVYELAGPDITDPTVTSVTPANNTVDVAVNTDITILFSEPINTGTFAANINGGTAFATSFQNGNRVAVLNPNNNFDPATAVNVSVSGLVEDRVGHTLGSPYQWSFTTSAQSPAWVETTTADFSDGTLDNILISSTGDGELGLDQTSTTQQTQTEFNDDFSGPDLNWDSLGNPQSAGADYHLDSGKLIHGTLGASYHPAVPQNVGAYGTFEFNVDADSPDGFWGIAWGLQDNAHYYMAQSYGGTFAVFRLDNWFNNYTMIGSFPAPGIVPGTPQHVRLLGDNGTYTVYIDGALIGTLQDATYAIGKVGVVGYGGSVTNFDNASLVGTETTVIPGGTGTYTSDAHDYGGVQVWGQLSWTGPIPTGTSVQFATRSSADNVTWSNWIDVGGSGNIASPAGRYIQYKVQLGTTELNVSPVVSDVTLTSSLQPTSHSLSVTTVGNGTVTSNPAGIDCGTACTYSFDHHTGVTLTATPSTGWIFTGWNGAGCTGTGTCTVTLDADNTVTASFRQTLFCVNPSGTGGCVSTIQEAIDAATAGDTINVFPGTYHEGNTSRDIYTGAPGGPASGLLVYKNGLTIQGVDANGDPILDRDHVAATIIATQRDVSLGDTVITGDNVTLRGLRFELADLPVSCNKNLFATGETFTLKDSVIDNLVLGCSGLYLSDERGGMHVNNFTIQGNQFLYGEITIINGVGQSGPASGRKITGNLIEHVTDWGAISLTGMTGNGWTTQPIGAVTITGNTLQDNAYQIIARGSDYANPAGYWRDFLANNTFDKAVLTLTPGEDARPDAYGRLDWVNNLVDDTKEPNFRMIGTNIQEGIERASDGDTVNLGAGTYVENLTINKPLTLAGSGTNTIIQPATSSPNCGGTPGGSLCPGSSNVILVQANNVVIHDLTIDGDNPALTGGFDVGGANVDARNGIITDHAAGVFNGLEVYNTTIQNIYLRGIYASSGGTFNFHHNTVTNVQAEYASIAVFAWGGPGTIGNNTVSYANDAISANHSKGIQFLNNTVTHSGSGVHTDNSGDSAGSVADLIQGNTVSDCSTDGYGIWTFVHYLPVVVENNTVTNCSIGLSAWGTGSFVTTPVSFTGNGVTGPDKAVGSVGAYLTTSGAGWGYFDLYANFADNTFTNFETGVQLSSEETTWDPDPFVQKSIHATLLHNQVYGNTNGADKGASLNINTDLREQWWGAASGPSGVGPGTGDSIGAGLSYTPWCLDATCNTLSPEVVILGSPTGTLTSWNNTFAWTGISGADYYRLEVYDADDAMIYGQWYNDSICTGLDCAVSPAETLSLANGSYKWKVRTYGVSGFGDWTDFTDFSLDVPTLSLISPTGTLTSWNNTFRWTGTSSADFYQIEVSDTSDLVLYSQWYTTSICTGLNCAVSPAVTQNLANGDYKWKVRTYGSSGFTAWTVFTDFTLDVPTLSPISPTGTQTAWDNTFGWTGTSGADFYQIEVADASDLVVYSQWYTTSICTGLDCAVSPAETQNLANGDYKWKVRTYGSSGFTAWTAFTDFTLDVPTLSLNSPTGTQTAWDNTFGWTGISTADFYQLEVYTGGDALVYSQWYTASICSGLDCAVSPGETQNLANGDYKWKVRTYGSSGFTAWTDFTNFTLNAPQVVLAAPSGEQMTWSNTFHWTGTSGADFYRLQVYDVSGGTVIFDQWYTTSICTDLDCAVSPAETQNLANGDYQWRVQTYGVTGFSPWTPYLDFNLNR